MNEFQSVRAKQALSITLNQFHFGALLNHWSSLLVGPMGKGSPEITYGLDDHGVKARIGPVDPTRGASMTKSLSHAGDHPAEPGKGVALNHAISRADTDLIMVLDADSLLHPTEDIDFTLK